MQAMPNGSNKTSSVKISPYVCPEQKTAKSLREKSARSKISHLYSRNNLYYFRFVFPDPLQGHFQKKEFRYSLKTGYLRTAKSMAVNIYSEILRALKETSMPSYDELRNRIEALHKRFYDLLPNHQTNEQPLPHETIRSRMFTYLEKLLQQDSANIDQRVGIIEYTDNGIKEIMNTGLYAKCTSSILLSQVNSPPALKELAPRILIHLVKEKFFEPNEISKDNVLHIANEYLKMEILYKKIIQAREEGDYGYELQILSSVPKQNEDNQIAKISTIESKQKILRTYP